MATMKDVAEKAGVSMTTVSYVVNGSKNISDEVKERVHRVIRELNYKANKTAQNLARNNTRCIGLYGADLETLKTHLFFNELMSGILSVTTKSDYNLIIYPEQKNEDGEFCITMDHGEPIDGAIIINPRVTNDYLKRLIEKNIPFVLIGRPNEFQDQINYIDTDNVAVGYNITKPLLSLNHSKILLLNGPEKLTLTSDILEGYKIALTEYNANFSNDLLINAEFTSQAGFEAVKQKIADNLKFSAIIACSDTQAIGAVNALNTYGFKVPKDISLVCCSDTYLTASYNPQITAVNIKGVEIGAQAAAHLIDILEKRLIKPSHRIVSFDIHQRETTAYVRLNNG